MCTISVNYYNDICQVIRVQRSMVDTDIDVGYWVRNLPYLFNQEGYDENEPLEKRWKRCSRTYLLPKGYPFMHIFIRIQKSRDCSAHVKKYFKFVQDDMLPDVDYVKVQGDLFSFPIFEGKMIGMTLTEMYDYLDLPTRQWVFEITNDRRQQWIVSPPRGTSSELQKHNYDVARVTSATLFSWMMRNNDRVQILRLSVMTTTSNPFRGTIYSEPSKDLFQLTSGRFEEAVLEVNYLIHSSKKRWLASYLSIEGPPPYGSEFRTSHANLLLIDLDRREVYIFDPWGKGQTNNRKLAENVLVLLGIPISIYGWKIRETEHWCPRIGPQDLERPLTEKDLNGYCSVWSLWLLELITKYPDEELQVIFRRAVLEISKRSDGDLLSFIRGYAEKLRKETSDISNISMPSLTLPCTKHSGQVLRDVRKAHLGLSVICDVKRFKREELEELWINLIYCSGRPVYYYKELDVIMYDTTIHRVDTVQTIEGILKGRMTNVSYKLEGNVVEDVADIDSQYHADLFLVLREIGYVEIAKRVFPNVRIEK